MSDQGPFPQDALEANRAGKLTSEQRKGFRGQSRGFRKAELQFAVIVTVLGLLIWFAQGPAKYATVKPLIGIGCLIIAGFLVVRSFLGADAVTQDLRSGRVDSVEGAITKTTVNSTSGGSSLTSYYFTVSGKRVKVWRDAYHAAPDAGMVRIYYLPHSHELVNMERLADTGLSPDAMKSPDAVKEILVQAFHSHDPNQAAVARAHLATMEDAMNSAMTTGAPPPGAGSDPRPLAQAIVGNWSNAMMNVSFTPDGTMTAEVPGMPGSRPRTGHWSVDASGHLVSDVMGGGPMPTDAWVTGDELTINLGDRGITFQRVAK